MIKRFLFFGAIIYSLGCGKEKCHDPANASCDNYDPCVNKSYTADFRMYQSFDFKSNNVIDQWGKWNKDTVYNSEFFDGDIVPFYYDDRFVFISSTRNAISYRWKIGNDPRDRRDTSFTIGFNGNEGTIEVLLIVEFDPNDPCNKEHKQFDTVIKSFTIQPDKNKMTYVGSQYKIKNQATNESKIIDIKHGNYRFPGGINIFFRPIIVNLLDSFTLFEEGNSWYGTHFCSREIYLNIPNCDPEFLTKADPLNNQVIGRIKFNNDKIFIEYNRSITLYNGTQLIKAEIEKTKSFDGFKL